MDVIFRIVGCSLVAALLVGYVAYNCLGPHSDTPAVSMFLGCVGAIVGAIAGGAREIVIAKQKRE
jgi:hypothetical protein